jgi:RimJ/RimL family protein N-acetyltransferase
MLRPTFPIETERLRLRPYRADDLDALHAIQSNAEVVRYLYWGVRTRDAVRDDLARRIRQDAIDREGDKLILALERRDGAGLVGDVNLVWVSREHRQGEIGFVLHPDHHGRGFAAEGAAVLLRLGFETLGLHRIIGRCDGRNVASVRVMEKLGMRREAHFRQNERVKGEWTDEIVCALLADEWASRMNAGRVTQT